MRLKSNYANIQNSEIWEGFLHIKKKLRTPLPRGSVWGRDVVRSLTLAYAKRLFPDSNSWPTSHQGTTLPLHQGSPSKKLRTPLPRGSSLCESMGEGCCTQSYPCICKETVSGFERMTNKSPRHNFTAAPGLALRRLSTHIPTKVILNINLKWAWL